MSEPVTGSRAERRRSETDERIMSAVLDVIGEGGLRAVTIEAVTARSGIAKTTIYRRYTDRYDLLAATLEWLSPTLQPPAEGGITREGMVRMLSDAQAAFEDRIGLRVIGQIIAGHEEMSRGWRERVVEPRMDAWRRFFADGVRTGVLVPDLDYDVVAAMLMGGMVMTDVSSGEVPDDWAESVMRILWPVISAQQPTPAPADEGAATLP